MMMMSNKKIITFCSLSESCCLLLVLVWTILIKAAAGEPLGMIHVASHIRLRHRVDPCNPGGIVGGLDLRVITQPSHSVRRLEHVSLSSTRQISARSVF
jgi:hypothetical protein